MNAIITVIGHDKVGIIAKVSNVLSRHNINILDINQTIMKTFFTMVMLVDISDSNTDFGVLANELESVGTEIGLQVKIQHEDIFNSMHRI